VECKRFPRHVITGLHVTFQLFTQTFVAGKSILSTGEYKLILLGSTYVTIY